MKRITQLFPGQGSQSLQMMSELYQSFPEVKNAFTIANEVLGFDLWDLIQSDADALNQTENTQVAMLVSGYATHLVLENNTNFETISFAGHSLGEWTALLCAGFISFEDALVLVRKRGELMRDAVPNGQGAMAAILGLDDKVVIDLCSKIQGIVEAVNFNSPGQIVISGEKQSVEKTCELAKENGARRALILPVSVPSHSSLMKEAAQEFKIYVDKVNWLESDKKVIHNVDVSSTTDIEKIKQNLVLQLYKPVLWTQTIQSLTTDIMIECGPGKVLTGLNKRINKEILTYPLFDNKSLEEIKNANG
ncbi:Malonyl CoA-acyl carrier protein transacylase [hydrothermal vent metagenome]|uniref:[acyl-carrier-protein] S-malonyltransferase n=1 Tax=hydrothermal vent metagenome TaxID=652676 RepID=A0A1W1CHI3_9ZZZZ